MGNAGGSLYSVYLLTPLYLTAFKKRKKKMIWSGEESFSEKVMKIGKKL